MSLDELFAEKIFTPLEMTRTTFRQCVTIVFSLQSKNELRMAKTFRRFAFSSLNLCEAC
eukprot:COSAG06_NODE_8898_length_2037_cov_9.738296_1_plen_59_part_00